MKATGRLPLAANRSAKVLFPLRAPPRISMSCEVESRVVAGVFVVSVGLSWLLLTSVNSFFTWLDRLKSPSVTLQVLLPRRRRRRTGEKGKVRGHPTPRQETTVPCIPAEELRLFFRSLDARLLRS
jgi:hypothetical protein